jgi:ATP-binding cassette subfamily B protein
VLGVVIPSEYITFWSFLSSRRKAQFLGILILILATSFMEVISIGAIVPFIGVMTSPEKVYEIDILHPLWKLLNIYSSSEILFPLTSIFCLAALLAGGFRILLLFVSTKVSFATGSDISIEIYKRTLYQPYSVHVARNSSETISGILGKANQITSNTIQPVITVVTSIVLLTVIFIGLILIDPTITLVAFSSFTMIYFGVALSTKHRLSLNSQSLATEYVILYKSLQEGLGGIRDVLLNGTQSHFLSIFQDSDVKYRKSVASNSYIGQSPRFIMEALGMTGMAIFAYALILKGTDIVEIIPIMGALGLGAQRMLPVLQQFYSSWVSLRSGKQILLDVNQLILQPLPEYYGMESAEPISFQKEICLNNINFKYNKDERFLFQNLNLSIPKGSRVGFIGKTGSGKSTLVDIIMGLLTPESGNILIDSVKLESVNIRNWQSLIAHVPQSIYLSDATIAENIAFGVPKDSIDNNKVYQSAKKAQIYDHIAGLKEGFNTMVGERGVRLSGGQQQRIGIARALYKNASVLIFDEATSALDNNTELEVMSAIEKIGKDITILFVAHRLTTIKHCDLIIELSNGNIVRFCKYEDLVE